MNALFASIFAALAVSLSSIEKPADVSGGRCGVLTGFSQQAELERTYRDVEFLSYNDICSLVEALRLGKVDAVALDTVIAQAWRAKFPGELRVTAPYDSNPFGFLLPKNSPLLAKMNRVVNQLIDSGELKRIVDKWCDCADASELPLEPMPAGISFTGKNGTLTFATPADFMPGAFVRKDGYAGFDIDIMRRVAWELDMKLEIALVPMSALIVHVQAGKSDVGGGCITITSERLEKVDFTVSYLDRGNALLVREAEPVAVEDSLVASFRRTFVVDRRYLMFVNGLETTLLITFLSAIIGTLLAFPVWRARVSENAALASLARAYIAIMQGTPVLVLLLILYYIVFGSVDLDGVWVAVLGFSLNESAYFGEMLRSGVDSIPRGQVEAALALGYTPSRAFRRFVLPQAIRAVLPVYRGELVGLLKMTSIVGYIAIVDLTKASDLVRARTYDSFFPIITSAIIYFAAAWLLATALEWFGRRLDPATRRGLAK